MTEVVDRLPKGRALVFVHDNEFVVRIGVDVSDGDRICIGHHMRRLNASTRRRPLGGIEYRWPMRGQDLPFGVSWMLRFALYVTPHADDPLLRKAAYAAVKLGPGRYQMITVLSEDARRAAA